MPSSEQTIAYVGADGCKGGRWIAYLADEQLKCTAALFDDLTSLFDACKSARRILIDVPIGLNSDRRRCDIEAKHILSRNNSRVFFAPIRPAITATDWAEANRVSREVGGHGLSKQAWAIVPRIRETDEFLRANPAARATVRECHPEICFWGLGGKPMLANKKKPEGAEARLSLLEPFIPDAGEQVRSTLAHWPRSVLSLDDAIDALVAVVTAAAPSDKLRSLPKTPQFDECGLPMEMVYRASTTPT